MDESTDIAGLMVLILFVCYVYLQSYQKNLLTCGPIQTNPQRDKIFNILDEYLSPNEIPTIQIYAAMLRRQ